MLTASVPTRESLIRRVSELVPQLQKNAKWAEDNRRLADDSIDALADAGVFKLRVPRRHGGYESDTRTLLDVATELGRADGSLAWTASVYWIPTWMTCLFPDEVQDEVFATPNVRICGTLSPSATAVPAKGGVVVNGRWGFVTGALHSHWQEILAVLIDPNGGEPMPIMALVPMSDLRIVDDWHTAGLRGTGSVSTVAQELFVPSARVLPLPAVLQGHSASKSNGDSLIYRAPLLPVAAASSVGTVIGLANAALEAFLQRLPGRKITYTNYTSQSAAPMTHLQVAEAAQKLDQATFHAHRLAATVDDKSANGDPWTLEERAKARADLGTVCQLGAEIVDVLSRASGGSSLYTDVSIQRIARDVHAVNLHALMHPDTNAELYGRILCGQEPNTLYI
jgi:alkylation response protein AidB-like acyl-CoA dehydrogenase